MDLPIDKDKFIKLGEEILKEWEEIQKNPLIKSILENMDEKITGKDIES